jgi:gamma-glutamylputrescine oxidase
VHSPGGVVRARAIVVCLDRFAPTMGIAREDVFHAQSFLTLTEPLDDALWSGIFPDAPLLVWDSDLVYQYFRRTGEGRLLVGGGRLSETYAREHPTSKSFDKLERYARAHFPPLRDVRFTHAWQGLIGMSKDVLPIAGRSPAEPAHYLALCAGGLPWSMLAGECAADILAGRAAPLERFFAPQRRFNRIEAFQPLLGKPLTWALSYYFAKH